jgi:molybdopterin converting factor small subunit
MKKESTKILRHFMPQWVLNAFKKRREKTQISEWNKNGCTGAPPHIVKQMTIAEYRDKYGYEVLVETGTYMGDMVEAQKKRFKKIFSIELGVDLFNNATRRFKNDKNVAIVQGDSGKILPKILLEISEPAVFWLDGHYSEGITAKGEKECPIFEELDAIFNNKKFNHILLIDDARCFIGEGDYPTIPQLTEYIKNKDNKYKVEVKNDIIRFAV